MATEQEKMCFYLPAEDAERVRRICEQDHRSLSGYIRLLLHHDFAVRAPLEETDGAAA